MSHGEGPSREEAVIEDDTGHLPPLWSRFAMVFFSPGKLFQHLARQPAWGWALVLGALLVLLSNVLMPPEIFLAQMRQQLIESGRPVPDQLPIGGNLFRTFAAVGGLVIWPVITCLMAGLVALIFTFILGGEATYRQYLAVTAHAFLVSATSTLLLLPLRIGAEDPQLLLSVGTFFPSLGGYPGNVLRLLDLFGLWTWVLVALGVSVLDKKQSWVSATAIVMIIPLGTAAVFAIFM